MFRTIISATLFGLIQTMAHAYQPATAKPGPSEPGAASAERQYTFAWKFIDGDTMAPRGGTSKGAPVSLAAAPSSAWKTLQTAARDTKDHTAILAMAGEYRVSFDFIEVAGFTEQYQPSKPYQSWGTEKVYVLEDKPGFVSLQHVLVMQVVMDPKKPPQTMVTKHWRQDWQFEPKSQIVYLGPHRWQQIPVNAQAAAGTWSQTVYQVDDSPRYSGLGRWQHTGNYSSWIGSEGLRPLPRREWSARSDYQALLGTNRHTITPSGWVQEEQNNKVVLDQDGNLRAQNAVIAREFGFNRYELLTGSDFTQGDTYLSRTSSLWKLVREAWAQRLRSGAPIALKAAPDQGALFMPLFEQAESVQSDADLVKLKTTVSALVAAYFVPNPN